MTDDRAEFTANRDAGLVKRHEQRLARATGHASTCPVPCCGPTGDPVTDMVIPPAAIRAAAKAIYENDLLPGDWPWSALGQDQERLARGRVALEAALPHLRPMLELAGNLGRELGRREAAEEAAKAIEDRSLDGTWNMGGQVCLRIAAKIAREIATKEPIREPEAHRTRCSHCGFYRPSLLNHHPECPHAATKEPK